MPSIRISKLPDHSAAFFRFPSGQILLSTHNLFLKAKPVKTLQLKLQQLKIEEHLFNHHKMQLQSTKHYLICPLVSQAFPRTFPISIRLLKSQKNPNKRRPSMLRFLPMFSTNVIDNHLVNVVRFYGSLVASLYLASARLFSTLQGTSLSDWVVVQMFQFSIIFNYDLTKWRVDD